MPRNQEATARPASGTVPSITSPPFAAPKIKTLPATRELRPESDVSSSVHFQRIDLPQPWELGIELHEPLLELPSPEELGIQLQ